MINLLLAVLIIPATAAASWAHGRDKLSKGYIMALDAIAILGAALMMGHGWLWAVGLTIVLSPGWWFTYRSGLIATVELDFQNRHVWADTGAIIKAYSREMIPLMTLLAISPLLSGRWITAIVCMVICTASLYIVVWAARRWRDEKLEHEETPADKVIEGKNRSRVEIAGGLMGGIHRASLLLCYAPPLTLGVIL